MGGTGEFVHEEANGPGASPALPARPWGEPPQLGQGKGKDGFQSDLSTEVFAASLERQRWWVCSGTQPDSGRRTNKKAGCSVFPFIIQSNVWGKRGNVNCFHVGTVKVLPKSGLMQPFRDKKRVIKIETQAVVKGCTTLKKNFMRLGEM